MSIGAEERALTLTSSMNNENVFVFSTAEFYKVIHNNGYLLDVYEVFELLAIF